MPNPIARMMGRWLHHEVNRPPISELPRVLPTVFEREAIQRANDDNPVFRNQAPEPVGPDYGPLLMQQAIDWEAAERRVMEQEHLRSRLAASDHVDSWRYAQQAPQPSERSLTRERLRYAAERLRSGVMSTPWHEAPEWLSHRKNELVELPYIMEYGSVVEYLLRWEGSEYVVLPTISLKTGQVEYKKGSPEPQNGKERTECEEFAMKEIRKWAAENKTLAAMA